jgi:serine/threonine-protein kinase
MDRDQKEWVTDATLVKLPDPAERVSVPQIPPPGYQFRDVIGRGGMGEVIAAHDQRIGREVAFKRIRGSNVSAEDVARFVREARIQARLDHPAIVPVYELGTDENNNPYFTMKRLAGETLATRILCTDVNQPIAPMLRAFIDVCLAIDFAHARGVIHRDLKPSNIMLGDYGEVYVLDWGVAHVLASDHQIPEGQQGELSLGEIETHHGAVLGTPGYIAPEQIRGMGPISPSADVYALGAILFEILARKSLHPTGMPALDATLAEHRGSPAERCPDRTIAPELDAVCVEALTADPQRRPTARELANRVQRYLDGYLDVERRRALAAEQLSIARAAFESNDPNRRAQAIRAAGHALALEPTSSEAAALVSRLIVEPPAVRPRELDVELARNDQERRRSRARNGMLASALTFVVTLAILAADVKRWPMMLVMWGAIAGYFGIGLTALRTGDSMTRYLVIVSAFMTLALSQVASPLVLAPVVLCGTALSVVSASAMTRSLWRPIAWVAVTAALPYILEFAGVLPSTMTQTAGALLIESGIVRSHGWRDLALLIGVNYGVLVTVVVFIARVVRDRHVAEQHVEIQAWHLRHLLPSQTPTRGLAR